MSIDISQLNAAELDALAKEIQSRKIEAVKEAKRSAYEEMLAVAEKYGVDFVEVVALHSKKTKAKKASAVYVNPNDPDQTWSGRGRKPAWVHKELESGRSLDELKIG